MSAAWVSAHWPAMLSAATHARQVANSAVPPKFEFFSPEQAVEIEAVSARIIPTTDTPGAREAGVVFFIDRALVTFGKANQKLYTEGLPALQARFRPSSAAQTFFEAIRVDTISGFLIDPASDKLGNRDGLGWKVIGRDDAHMFQPPFGYYDKDYPGWQPNPADADKTNS